MKNRLLNIALLSLIIACISCNKITESIQQDVIINDTIYFDIPVLNSTTTSITISGISSEINFENEIKNSMNNFTINDVKTTRLTSLNLALGLIVVDKETNEKGIDPENNFGNLETLQFGIAANEKTGKLSSATISSGGTSGSLTLPPTIDPENLKPFLINPSKTYNIIVKAKKITTTPMKVQAAAKYTITLSR